MGKYRTRRDMYLKMSKISTIIIFGLLFLISRNLYSQANGFKYFKYYSNEEYDHQAQNWGMVQAPNGIIYVANHGGVLEFDGVSWRIIGIPGYDTVRSLAIDKAGTVFIGGINKIGYLTPDSNGSLKYLSLLGHLVRQPRRSYPLR